MELLIVHEEQLEKERGQADSSSEDEGEILSDYGNSNEEEYENQHTITRDLEMLTERLNSLRRRNMCLTRSPKDDSTSSSRRLPPLEISCYKCKNFGHYITDCPAWEMDVKPSRKWNALNCTGFKHADRHTKLTKKNDSASTSSSMRPVTDTNPNAVIESNMKRISKLAGAYAGMTMDSEDEISESESDEENEFDRESGHGHAFVAHASSTSSIYFDSDSSDVEAPAFCFMAKASRDQVSPK